MPPTQMKRVFQKIADSVGGLLSGILVTYLMDSII